MVRLFIFAAVVAVALMIYTLIECARTENHRVRSLPRPAWFAVIILLPLVGAVLWFVLGRPVSAASAPAQKSMAPDDDEDFLRQLEVWRRQQQREADLNAREQELNNREKSQKPEAQKPEAANGSDGTEPKNKSKDSENNSPDTE